MLLLAIVLLLAWYRVLHVKFYQASAKKNKHSIRESLRDLRRVIDVLLAWLACVVNMLLLFHIDTVKSCIMWLFIIYAVTGVICHVAMIFTIIGSLPTGNFWRKFLSIALSLLHTSSIYILNELISFSNSADTYIPVGTELYFVKYATYVYLAVCLATSYYNLKNYVYANNLRDSISLAILLRFLKFSQISIFFMWELSETFSAYIHIDKVFLWERYLKHIDSYGSKHGYISPKLFNSITAGVRYFCNLYRYTDTTLSWDYLRRIILSRDFIVFISASAAILIFFTIL